MADIAMNPYLGGNPYLAMFAPTEDDRRGSLWSTIGDTLIGLGAGVAQGGVKGIAPGLMMGNQLTAAGQKQDEDRRMRRAQLAMMSDHYRSQADASAAKTRLAEDAAKRKTTMGGLLMAAMNGEVPGFNVQPSGVQLGQGVTSPAGFDLLKYLTDEKGLPTPQAAAIAGHFQQESGFNPTITHDGGTGYGLGGWRLDRRDALQRYASLRGMPVSDPKLQADFFLDEIKSRPEYRQFASAQTPDDASTALMHYFRPANYTPDKPQAGHGFGNRVANSRAYAGVPTDQGDAVSGAPGGGASGLPPIDPRVRAIISTVALDDPEKAATMYVQHLQGLKKDDAWAPLTEDESRRTLGTAHDPTQAYQRNKVTGEIRPIGSGAKDPWADLTPNDVKMFPGLDPNKGYQRNRVTGEIKQIGTGPQVQIDMGTKGATEFVKQRADNYENKIRPAAQAAVGEITSMHSMRQLLDSGAFTGLGAEQKLWAARVGELLGVPNERVANTQALMGAAAERVLSVIKSLGANPSNADREYLEKAKGGTIAFSEDGLRRILDIGERMARDTIKRHGAEVGRLQKIPALGEMPTEYFQLDDAPDYATWSKANPLPPISAPPAGTPPPNSLDAELERRGLNKPRATPAPAGSPLDQELKRRGLQ